MIPSAHAATPARIAPVALAILESLNQHRLLSTTQVHDLHTPDASIRWTQRLLARLRDAELIDVARLPGRLGVWYLTTRGLDAVETIPHRTETRLRLLRPEQAHGLLTAHTLAVNDVGIAFVNAARKRGHECGPYAWRHEIAHPLAPPRRRAERLIADAILTYQLVEAGQPTSFHYRFVELDRATSPVDALATKLARYAQLYRHATPDRTPLWTRRYPVFPTVLVALAADERDPLERRRRTVLALCREDDNLRHTPEVEIAVCLLADLTSAGPFAPIFHTLTGHPAVSWLAGAEA